MDSVNITIILAFTSIISVVLCLIFMSGFFAHSSNLKELRRVGRLETKKGVYTFTAHKENTEHAI